MSARPSLLVFDLDGTVLGGPHEPYARIPAAFCAWLDAFSERGGRWAINSTWGPSDQWRLLQDSPVASRPAWLICELGRNLARVDANGLRPLEPYTSGMCARLAACGPRFAQVRRSLAGDFEPKAEGVYEHWYDFTPRPEDSARFRAHVDTLAPEYEGEFLIERCGADGRIIVHPRFLSKGPPLGIVLAHDDVRPEQVIVAGNGSADLPMMQRSLAHRLVAPSDAESAVLAHVRSHRGVVGRFPASDGVLDALARLGLPAAGR